MNLENIPAELKQRRQWVVWKAVPKDKRIEKVPHIPGTTRMASTTEPTTWRSYPEAVKAWQGDGWDGIGYVFTEEDGDCGTDLDKSVTEGTVKPWASEIVKRLNTYTELSPSASGLHIIGKGKLPQGGRHKGEIEMYDTGRFFTMTGDHLAGTPTTIKDRGREIAALHREVFGEPQEQQPTTQREPLDISDVELLALAMRARNGDKFRRLWEGDITGHASPSEADLALCNELAFWCGGPDRERIDRLFRQSGLYRDKWDRENYRKPTISKALENRTDYYEPPRQQEQEQQQTATPEPEMPPTPEHHSDMGNARRLARQHGQDLRYCHPWGKWLVWDGVRFVVDDTAEVERKAKATVATIYAEAARAATDEQRKAIAKHAIRSESRFRIQAMMNLANSELGIPVLPDQLDADNWLLNCQNGTIDLRTGKLLPHQREDLITKLAPVHYDAGATYPLFEKFLNEIMAGNRRLMAYLQRAVGYSLTGLTIEQCLFILWGTGMNGKSTFLQTISAMMGDYARRTPTESLLVKRYDGIPNDIAALKGARMVSALESEHGRRLAEAQIKGMTGGDTVAARFMRGEWFEFVPVFKIFLGTNHKPVIRGTDHAIWRRIRLIPFTVRIPESQQDKHLADKLKEELPGILAWAIKGCLDWQRQGLGAPQEVVMATEGYRGEMDPVADFIDACCVCEPSAWARAGQLYSAYKQWTETNGEKPISNRRFGDSLTERDFPKTRDKRGNKYLGIGLVDDPHPEN